MRGHESSNAKLTQTQDLGACSPAVQPCRRYSLRLSSTRMCQPSSVFTTGPILVNVRSGHRVPFLEPSEVVIPTAWTTPPVPEGANRPDVWSVIEQ